MRTALERILKILGLCLLTVLLSATVKAAVLNNPSAGDAGMGSVEWTEADRYNPAYYLPIESEQPARRTVRKKAQAESFENVIVQALKARETSIDVSRFGIEEDKISTKYWQVLHNHPELFYVKSAFKYNYNTNNHIITKLIPSYLFDMQETQELQRQIDDVAARAMESVSDEMEDYEKALVIHDWLATYCEYDYEHYLQGAVPQKSHRLDGALLDRAAVCDGYAKAYQYIMQNKLGIPCYLTSSETMNHAWNIIQINGKYYHVDVTWDDPVRDYIGRVKHTNFLLSDAGISKERHEGWETTLQAADTSFDAGVWRRSDGSIICYDGKWYYVDAAGKQLLKTGDICRTKGEVLFTVDSWKLADGGSYTSAFAYLQRYHNKLIFNGPKKIYIMSLENGSISKEIAPPKKMANGENIYGIYLDGTTLYYAIQSKAISGESQKAYIYSMEWEKDFLQGNVALTGKSEYGSILSAQITLGKGIGNHVSYTWYRDGILIDGETGPMYELTKEDIGKVVAVAVAHRDYTGILRAQVGPVKKAEPDVLDVQVLKGAYGDKLSSVVLPDGYTWEEPDIVMSALGRTSYSAVCCPDRECYNEVKVRISVDVKCMHHLWDEGLIITEPTCILAGEKAYICEICGEIRTEEISAMGHTWDKGIEIQKPSFEKEGIREYTCNLCHDTMREPIDRLEATQQPTPTAVPTAEPKPTAKPSAEPTVKPTAKPSAGPTVKPTAKPTMKPATPPTSGTLANRPAATPPPTGLATPPTPAAGQVVKDAATDSYYQILSTGAGGGTASFLRQETKTKKAKVPAVIYHGGRKYKVTSIAPKAFAGNKKLKNVVIGKNVIKIQKKAFANCKKLSKVTVKSKVLSKVAKNAFKGTGKKLTVKVPKKKRAKYKKLFRGKGNRKLRVK